MLKPPSYKARRQSQRNRLKLVAQAVQVYRQFETIEHLLLEERSADEILRYLVSVRKAIGSLQAEIVQMHLHDASKRDDIAMLLAVVRPYLK